MAETDDASATPETTASRGLRVLLPAGLFGLPAELLGTGRQRVTWVAHVAALMALALAGMVLAEHEAGWIAGAPFRAQLGANLLFGAASLAVGTIGRTRVSDALMLRVAIAYGWFAVAGYALGTQHHNVVVYGNIGPGAAPQLVLILFALIIPMAPAVAVAFIAVAVALIIAGGPVALWIEDAPMSARHLARATYHSVGAGVMAYIGVRIIYRLNRDVAEARQMGSYFLEERLGAGGMGEVWRARHRLLRRPAAVKLVRADALRGLGARDTGLVLSRFEREAQATAELLSPHSVQLYDFGRDDTGAFFYVMELLDGVDLETFVRRFGPMPPARAIHVLLQALDSLDDAHHQGLVHRDIKPANLFLCRRGRVVDFCKVLDFGIVALRSELERDAGATREVLGTPAYIAPELLQGDPIDGRADLYSLGCVAHWLLTGHRVFEGETPMALARAHLVHAPIPVHELAPHVPRGLSDLVASLLRKEPDERPPTAAALAAALRACPLDDGWDEARAERWWAHHLPPQGAPVLPDRGAPPTFLLRD